MTRRDLGENFDSYKEALSELFFSSAYFFTFLPFVTFVYAISNSNPCFTYLPIHFTFVYVCTLYPYHTILYSTLLYSNHTTPNIDSDTQTYSKYLSVTYVLLVSGDGWLMHEYRSIRAYMFCKLYGHRIKPVKWSSNERSSSTCDVLRVYTSFLMHTVPAVTYFSFIHRKARVLGTDRPT